MNLERVAGAPISWGVCEVPGWGYQLPPERVLAEMRDLGLRATELGPDGFLPDAPQDKAAMLARFGLRAVGGFFPVVAHDPTHDPVPELDAFVDACLATGADVAVLAAVTGLDGYDARPELDELAWKTLLTNLDRMADHARERGVLACLHPHMGTLVEGPDDIARVIEGARIGLCLDTDHAMAGGSDPVALARAHATRIAHVHLKDVDAAAAARVVAGETTFADAVRDGMWRPLGAGDVDVAAIVGLLEAAGYDGWYVLEQDVALDGPPEGAGPVSDVAACLLAWEQVSA